MSLDVLMLTHNDWTKQCTKCEEVKPLLAFGKDKHSKDGYTFACKQCRNIVSRNTQRNYAVRNKALPKPARNGRQICATCLKEKSLGEFRKDVSKKNGLGSCCKICSTEATKQWQIKNPEKRFVILREWEKRNPDKVKRYNRNRRSTSEGKLNKSLGPAIYHSLKGNKKGHSWQKLVDFTLDELRMHLEGLFQAGMTWENYGFGWHIDHKIPISVFNFNKAEDIDFKRCWSLQNLQPMWKHDNLVKHTKLDNHFQPALAMGIG